MAAKAWPDARPRPAKAAPVKPVARNRIAQEHEGRAARARPSSTSTSPSSTRARSSTRCARCRFSSRDTARAADILNMALRGQGLLDLADPGRLDLGGRLHARLPRHGEVQHDRRHRRHRRLDRRHGFLRSPRLQALPGRRPGRTTTCCARTTSTASTTPTSTRKSCRRATTRSYEIANALEPRAYSSREFIHEMGKWLAAGNAKKKGSLIQTRLRRRRADLLPGVRRIARPASAWSSTRTSARKAKKPYMTIDAVADFRELTEIKIAAGTTGLFMVGGGVPKNFAQDTVVCAEILGLDAEMHKYAVQITVADVRDGACSSSTLKEAASWGKVQHHARADGVRRSDHRRAADRLRRLSPRRLEDPQEAALGQAVRLEPDRLRRNRQRRSAEGVNPSLSKKLKRSTG